MCGTVEQPRYKVSSHLSVASRGFWPIPVTRPIASSCSSVAAWHKSQESRQLSLLVSLPWNDGMLLCLFHVVTGEVSLSVLVRLQLAVLVSWLCGSYQSFSVTPEPTNRLVLVSLKDI